MIHYLIHMYTLDFCIFCTDFQPSHSRKQSIVQDIKAVRTFVHCIQATLTAVQVVVVGNLTILIVGRHVLSVRFLGPTFTHS